MSIVKIEKLVYGGYGLGRDDGGVVFVSGTAAGETVEYEDDGTQGGVRLGRATKVIEPSPHRRVPPCPHVGTCGGCDWIHIAYDEQVRCKKDIFMDCIKRIGKFDDHPDDVEAFTANEFGYRSRAQIKIDHRNKCAGFFKKKTNDVVKIDKCPLLADEINDLLSQLNSDMSLINSIPEHVGVVKILCGKTVASYPKIRGVTNAYTEIDTAGITFSADGASFFQSNKFLLETMGRWARGKIGGGDCLDLYGGIGFFSLMLADDFKSITLVENIPAQVEAAKRNFRHNKKNHLNAVVADVERDDGMEKLTKEKRPDCIIVDPPRPGLVKKMRKWLIDTKPSVILYVSCNPSTFARDAGALVGGGYRLTEWALFDLYPNTHHIESAAVFKK